MLLNIITVHLLSICLISVKHSVGDLTTLDSKPYIESVAFYTPRYTAFKNVPIQTVLDLADLPSR